MLHEIRVNGYAAEADGPLDLGTWGSYGTEQLHFTFDAAWDDLTKSVTFSTDGYTGEAVTLLLPESGRVEVPQQATAAQTVCGRITVLGTCAGVQRISADLPYQTRNHSAVPGQAPHSLPSAFEEISTAAQRACSRAQNAEDAAALAQTSAQVAQTAAQDAVRVAASAQKIARSVRDDADAGAFQGEKLTYADLTEQDKADLRRPALEAAATANEAVAGLGQTLLRYGVQVGQIGEIVLFADGTLHPNHLWADGSEIDPAAYPELAAFAAGDKYAAWLQNEAAALAEALGENANIAARPADLPLLQNVKLPVGTTLTADESIELGGLKGANAANGLVADDTLAARLNAQHEWFLQNAGLEINI